MTEQLERILARVERPARYVGGEYGQVIKDKKDVDTRVAFCFPDTYEVGMSNLGLRILYGIKNSMDGVWCERVFAPWGDMEDEMRKAGLPLYALESGDPIKDFDLICFTLQYEMSYTNVLNMIDLAGLEVRAENRTDIFPLIIAGGSCAYNGEPMAPFVDAFVLGEGEEMNVEVVKCIQDAKREGLRDKHELLLRLAKIPGVYVPSFYDVEYNDDGTVKSITPNEDVPARPRKRIVTDLDSMYFPCETVIPSTEVVFDRVTLEIMRGCIRGCRFCQAGQIYRPVRRKSPQVLIEQAKRSLEHSGYEEVSLASLSTSDFKGLGELCDGLIEFCEPRKVNLSLPSLRADNFSFELMERVQKVRKSGLTFAAEAGTQRLRDAINKNVREEELANTCRIAFEGGYSTLKIYFMIGLPTETDEDVEAIAGLCYRMWKLAKECATSARGVRITASVACFVPKAFTPFQWEKQDTRDEFLRKIDLLKKRMPKAINLDWHEPSTSYLEAVFARGDRRLADALEAAWRKGAKFDGWSEYFSLERWMDAFKEVGIDPDFYALRERSEDEVLPWSHIDVGVSFKHMLNERHAAYRSEISPDCRVKCTGCGANCLLEGGHKCDE